jgi:hypothetical protein
MSEVSSGMRSETLTEAAARMKALSEAEKRGMEVAKEGILTHDPDPDGVFEERAAQVDQIGEQLLQVQDQLNTDMDFSAPTEVGEDGTAQPRRKAKRSRRRG